MPEKKKGRTGQRAATSVSSRKTPQIFSAEERAAMREHAQEVKRAAKRPAGAEKEDEAAAVLEKIASMPAPDRAMAERLHQIIMTSAPQLSPRLWYGMPAYTRNGQVVCFFQGGYKFKARYGTLGFSDKAALDDGNMWPTSFALTKLSAADEAQIAALVKKAAREQ